MMDLRRRHSRLETELRIFVLTLFFISSSSVASHQLIINPCDRPTDCENGTRVAYVADCNWYYECGPIDDGGGGASPSIRLLGWNLKSCGKFKDYDYLRQTCVIKSNRTQTCVENCNGRVELNLTQHTSSVQLFEGDVVRFVCCFRYLFFRSQVQVQSFQWSFDGQKITKPGNQITIKTDKEENNETLCSTLTFDPITRHYSGFVQCAVNYRTDGSYVIMKESYVNPVRRPSVSIHPLTLDVFDAEPFVLRCSLSSAEHGKFVWFEDGNVIDPSCKCVNISHPSPTISLLQKSSRLQRDPITFSCMARTDYFVNTTIQNASVFVINANDRYCDGEYDNERLIKWGRTKIGRENVQPCPQNNTVNPRFCSRKCSFDGSGLAVWSQPNCNDCVNEKFDSILNQLDRLQSGVGLDNQTAVAEIASELSALTKSVGISPGDLNASLQAINQLGNLRKNSAPNNAEITSVIQTMSNILQPNNSDAWRQLQAANATVISIILSSADVYGRSLSMMINDSKPKRVGEDYLVLEAASLDRSNLPQEIAFPSDSVWNEESSDSIYISAEALESASIDLGQRINVWSSYYRNIEAHLPTKNTSSSVINSRVLSLTVNGLPEKLKRPVIVTLQHNRQEDIENLPRTCVFWKFSDKDGGEWDSTGCSVLSTTTTHTVCSCDHLTNFAILMSLNPSDDVVLSIVSTVGCCISVACLILTVIIYVATWKQMKSDQAAVLLNLCLALIIANIIFLAGADKVDLEAGCKAVAVLLHYFFLAAFFLMLAEGVELLLYIIFVFHVRSKIETASLIAAAWVLSLIIVTISLGATKADGYGSKKSCWLSVETGLIWAFIGPALCIIAANLVILAIVLRRISQARFSAAKNEKKSRIRATLWNISVICPVLGAAWVFGVLSVSFDSVVFQYLFAIANSLQGVLIFIFHALFHNKAINEKMSALLSHCVQSQRKPDLSGSHTSAAPLAQSPNKVPKQGNVPVLVQYYQGLANEAHSNTNRKQDTFVTSSTVLSSSTNETTTSSYDNSTIATEDCNTNASSMEVQTNTNQNGELRPTSDGHVMKF